MDYRDWPVYLIVGLVPTMLLAMLITVVMAGFSPSFSLSQLEWECTKSHKKQVYSIVMAADVAVPTSYQMVVCDQYERRK